MARQSGYESIPQNTDITDKKEHTIGRRGFVKGAAVAMAGVALAGCGSKAETGTPTPEEVPFEPVTFETVSDVAVDEEEYVLDLRTFEMVPKSSLEVDLTYHAEIYKDTRFGPEEIRETAENGSEAIESRFNILAGDVPTPEDFPEVWRGLYASWLNSGCTPEEVEPYIDLHGDERTQAANEKEYLDKMHLKYDLAIFRGMMYAAENARNHETFPVLCVGTRTTRKQYLRNARNNLHLSEVAQVNILSHQDNIPVVTDGSYTIDMDVQIKNYVEYETGSRYAVNRSIYDIQGKLAVTAVPPGARGYTHSGGAIGGVINSAPDYREPIEELARLKLG